ncbi:hypothetical protein HKD28_10645 [Gluconobacter sp. LMG 1744]|uniref:hypothetical protein n=1 Tax=Gluconobacter TaxID=441 RepID=UPI000989FBCB|nr:MULTISPECIES: hypothetical protein [Gluconobacter]AQS92411.1 hypothetical protein A0U94_14665 [Gluconobacter albidus]MBF0891859.1 hypothetical protein [Gluconobacter cadivus]MBS1075697.1 hypothetical protein [Gluconobacter sp. Dm-73]MBS1092472.1 hypothetical protein [Gluconobacter sp. Dm-74]
MSAPLILCRDARPADALFARQIHDAVLLRLGAAHAALFSLPQSDVSATGTEWMTTGTQAIAAEELPTTTREALYAHAGSILADLRRVAQSEPGILRTYADRLRSFPDHGSLFVVDGRPVLARWGQTPYTPTWVSRFDDFRPPQAARVLFPASPNLLITALVAILFGLIAAAILIWTLPQNGQCLLADNIARWKHHDPTVMAGCWERANNMSAASNDVLTPSDYKLWEVCMKPDGQNGSLRLELANQAPCTAKATSHFDGDKTVLETEACQLPSLIYLPRTLTCHQHDSGHIACIIHVDAPLSELPAGYHQAHEGLLERIKPE